jgi:predicted nuclease of predicted toxin-antitoxin system
LKLLVDENLPPRLIRDLDDLFPGSTHVSLIGLGNTPDAVIWEYAKTHGFVFLDQGQGFCKSELCLGRPA